MRFLKRNFNVILVCLLEALIGILLLVNPVDFTTVIIIAFGIVLIIGGVFGVIGYFSTEPAAASFTGALVKGLAMLLAGVFLVVRPAWLISTFSVFTILYGIAVLLGGLYKTQWCVDALRLKTGRWLFHALNAAVSLICAFVILADPFASTVALWMFIGITLIVEAALDLVVLIVAGNRAEPPQEL